MWYCTEFIIISKWLWQKNPQGHHKMVVPCDWWLLLITSAHNDIRHHGIYATNALLYERYWWPDMAKDVKWFIQTCHLCQIQNLQQSLIPPVIAVPAPLFSKVYMDTMFMPTSGGYKYITQGHCSLVSWPEWAMLQKETGKTLGNWILHDFIYWWGLLCEIVTDNSPAFLKALAYLEKHYHIKHIQISGYNSWANGLIEWLHFDVQQAIFKACDRDESRWSLVTFSVFWAEQVMMKQRMGCSPYFAATGTHPLLLINIAEANYLLPPPDSTLSTTDLITRWAITLQKQCNQLSRLKSQVYAARVQAAIVLEHQHKNTINDYNFRLGNLVLIRNTAIEKALNCKMHPRYLGPVIVISRNKEGACIISELDGSVFDRPIATFQVIPYLARTKIDLPLLNKLLDISQQQLKELKNSEDLDPEDDNSNPSDPLPDDWGQSLLE